MEHLYVKEKEFSIYVFHTLIHSLLGVWVLHEIKSYTQKWILRTHIQHRTDLIFFWNRLWNCKFASKVWRWHRILVASWVAYFISKFAYFSGKKQPNIFYQNVAIFDFLPFKAITRQWSFCALLLSLMLWSNQKIAIVLSQAIKRL